MQAYMKSDMPFLGIPMPTLRRIVKEVLTEHPLETFDEWRTAVLALWRDAEFREERYAAIELTGDRGHRHHASELLPLYEELVLTGAWWDLVDRVATNRIGPLLLSHPEPTKRAMREWSRSANVWKRRTSIICQVALKERTDLSLLYECIEVNLAEPDFFVRKAIGWALRAYAWTDPVEARRYVDSKASALSPLSRREATKNLARLLGSGGAGTLAT